MSDDQTPPPGLYTQVEVSSASYTDAQPVNPLEEQCVLLRQVLTTLEQQNKLLTDLLQQTNATQKQRAAELGQWKQANPELADNCRQAAETLSRVQAVYLENLVNEVQENADTLIDGEFMLTEFVDRFGPRLAHLNGVLQVLSQLGSNPQS